MTTAVRRATPADVDAMVEMVYGLAAWVGHAPDCRLTAPELAAALFGSRPALFAHVATAASRPGEVVGCALWFLNYSTWTGRHGIYLEDLFVRPDHRGTGAGKALLAALAAECVANDYSRLEWLVLDHNVSAVGFYDSLGAQPQLGATGYRLEGDGLRALGQASDRS